MGYGILAALAAGMSFAAAGVLQQRAASDAPADESLSYRLLGHLVRQRVWLAGVATAFVSYAFQAVALNFAPLALVQPLIVTELVFAIPVSARLRGMRLDAAAWASLLAVAGGLALGLWAADPQPGTKHVDIDGWVVLLLLVLLLVAGLLAVGRRLTGGLRASAYAAAAAVVLGTQSALLDETVHLYADHGALGMVTSFAPYAMAAAALTGTLLVQSAFQAGPLAMTMPVIDIFEPLSASAIGVFLLDEAIRADAGHVLVLSLALLVSFAGILSLDRSPSVQALREAQSPAIEPASTEAAGGGAAPPAGGVPTPRGCGA